MATYTTNLNLKKPSLTDPASIGDINANMDILDKAILAAEIYTDGIWTCRKWANGTSECWLTDGYAWSETPTTMTANGSLYESNTMTLALPTGLFFTYPNVALDTRSAGGMWLKCTGSTTNDTIVYEMLRTNNTKARVGMSVYCIGRWTV